jgi:predicted CXXCH cytochrome family protein
VMPVSFLLETGALRYKGYSVMVHERPGLAAGPAYSRTCIFCHNTAPYVLDLLGELGTRRMPSYQGEVVDRLLPDEARWVYAVSDWTGLRRAVQGEASLVGVNLSGAGDPNAFVRRAIDAIRNGFGPEQLLEVGIGCESCHGGAGDHVRSPAVLPSFEPRAPWLSVRSPAVERTRAAQINHACARCHQVLFTRYPWTWEGGGRRSSPGGSNISSGEGRDFLLGGCSTKMSCTACHDPHAQDKSEKMFRLGTSAGNAVCAACHSDLRSVEAQSAHSHHAPEGAGGACIACHMPRKNMALDGRLSRYHRIGSPTDPIRVLNDRPLECALCHADKTARDLIGIMERWWKKSYDRDALIKLYGSLDERPMIAAVERGKPHEQAVALFTLGERHERAAAHLIAAQLANDVPLVRQYAMGALELALGRSCDIDLARDLEDIERQADRCLAAVGLHPVAWPPRGPSSDRGEQPED